MGDESLQESRAENAPPDTPDGAGGILRLAIAMRGGVSLAVWIGGAMAEIDRLRRANGVAADPGKPDGFVQSLLGLTRFESVEVDVLSGASAGGLNAAIASTAFASGAAAQLKGVWLQIADIDRLLHHGEPPKGLRHRRSVLNGDYFLHEVTRLLHEIVEDGCDDRRTTVQAFLAVTVFDGMTVTNPLDPAFHDRRSAACFRFRHTASNEAFSHFMRPDAPERVGDAGRASASFPVAFEPVSINLKSAVGTLELPPVPPNQHGVAAGHLRLYDGGIVDNIPVARAIHAAAEAPSDQPVRRWVVFLHPSPDLDSPTRAPLVPTIAKVVKDFLGAAGQETLLDDLDVLAAHNRDVEAYLVQQYTLCANALAATLPGPEARHALASIDAVWIYQVLDEPAEHLAYVPVAQNPPLSPISQLDDHARFELRMSLLKGALATDQPLRPYAALVRSARFLIEWIRWLERHEIRVGADLRRRVYDIMQLCQLIDASLDRFAIDHVNESVVDTLLAEIQRIDRLESIRLLVDKVGYVDPSLSTDKVPVAWIDRLPPGLDDILAGLAGGVVADGQSFDQRRGIVERLRRKQAAIGRELFTMGRELDADPSVVTLVTCALRKRQRRGSVSPRDLLDVLDRIDRGQAGLHRGRAGGAPRSLDYIRISGARSSPLADPHFLREVGLHFGPASGLLQQDDGAMDPAAKLSGNTLANFSAFFSERFRANDWMWGRMDAASGLVEVLLRTEHLVHTSDASSRADEITRRVGRLLVPASDGDDPAAGSSDPLNDLFRELWDNYREVIHNEIVQAISGSETTLPTTSGLVTLRWQLQIMLDELGDVFAAPLEPDRPGEQFQFPPLSGAGGDDDESGVSPAAIPLRRMLAQYEALPRNVRALWGRRRSTALGVKVVRHATGAMYPERGALRGTLHVLVGAPLLVAVASLIQPATALLALAAVMNLVVFPTLPALGRWIAVIASLAVSLTFHKVVVRRALSHLRWWPAVIVVMLHAIPILGLWVDVVPLNRPRALESESPADLFRHSFFDNGMHGAGVAFIVTVVVVFFAALALWSWAKMVPRLIVAVISSAVMGWWAVVGAWQPGTAPSSWAWRLQQQVSSMWVPAVVLLAISSIYALYGHPENRPENPASPRPLAGPLVRSGDGFATPAPAGSPPPCSPPPCSPPPCSSHQATSTETVPCGDAAKPRPAFDVGVLAVHGIGIQSKGSTLRQFVDSIVGLLRTLTRAADPARDVSFTLVDEAESDDGFVRLEVPLLSPPLDRSQRWIVGEAWWSEAFDAPDRGESSRWLVDAGPFFAYYFAVRLWRRFRVGWVGVGIGLVTAGAATWLASAAATENDLLVPGLVAGIALLVLLISVLTPVRLGAVVVAVTVLIIFPVASVVTVAIVVLYLVGLLPGKWSKKVRALQVTLSRSVGDSSALISSPRREAAMLEAVLAATERLTNTADGDGCVPKPLVIVAHSQGASLVYRLFKRSEFRDVLRNRRVTLLTYGAAIHPLQLLEERIGDGSRPSRGRIQGIIGLLGFTLLLVPLERFATNSLNLTALICLIASAVFATISFVMVKVSTSAADGTSRHANAGRPAIVPAIDLHAAPPLDAQFRWVNFWAPWDPVPNGPLDLNERPTSREPSEAGQPTGGRAESCRVSNEHQPWRDHVVYHLNVEDVVSRWLAEITATGGASRADVRAFAELPPLASPGRWTAAQARHRRLWRGQYLFATQLALFAATVVAVARRWRDLPSLGRWLDRHSPNFVHTAVSGVANSIPSQLRVYLGASKDHTAHLYGLMGGAGAFGIACLALAFVMAIWHSRPAHLFANASRQARIGAPLRGIITSIVFAAAVAGVVVIAVN